jgi:type I restriction enzyme S subunit
LTLGLEHFGYQRHMKHLKVAEVPVWPLPTQQRIAAILSAYDDLIENNTRQIAILEEMARRLYDEWFVHFRFPGHEAAEFDGELPKGWQRVDLGALVDDRRDAVQPDAVDPSTPYVGLEHIPRRSITLREWSEASTVQSTKLLFREDDILFGKIRPYFHKVVLCPLGGVTSSDAIVLRAYSANHLALAALCASSDAFVDHATQTSNGTKMPRADWKVLKSYPVALPDETLLARFNGLVLPLFATLKLLNRKNANLRAQRDMLLPKLISGEIDVSGAEELLEAAE